MIALFVNGARVDLGPDADVRLTYTVESSQRPGERASGFSTTISCPLTPNNRRVFGFLDDLSVGQGSRFGAAVDRRAAQPARIEAEGVIVFQGTCIVERTTLTAYEVYVSGQDAPWQADLDRPLREILADDFNALHTWQANDVLPQRFNDGSRPTDKWIVPLVDYGRLQAQLTANVAHLEDLQPHAFVRQVIRLMFAKAGYQQGDDFFDRANASGLLLSAGEFKHVEGQPFDNLPSPVATIVRGASDGDNDNVGGYPLATNATSSALGGSYSIFGEYLRMRVKIFFTGDPAVIFPIGGGVVRKGFQLALYLNSDVDPGTNYWFGRLLVKQCYAFIWQLGNPIGGFVWVNRVGTPSDPSVSTGFDLQTDPATGWLFFEDDFVFRVGLQGTPPSDYFAPFRQASPTNWQAWVPVVSAGEVTGGYVEEPGVFAFDGTPDAQLQVRRVEFNVERDEQRDYTVKIGQAFNEVSVLPREMTGLELLGEVAKMFNLLVETDVVRRRVRLLPRDEFYHSTLKVPALDWQNRANLDDGYERTFLLNEHPRALEFRFADSADADTEAADTPRLTPTGGANWDSGSRVGEDPDAVELEVPALTEFSYSVGSPIVHRILAARVAPEPSPASVEPEPDDTVRIMQLCTYINQAGGSLPIRLITQPGYAGDSADPNSYGNAPAGRALGPQAVGDQVADNTRTARAYQSLRWADGAWGRGLLRYYARQLERVKSGSRLTVNLVLSIADILSFTFRRAVLVLSKTWDVEKINQFDPTLTAATEVELVSHIDAPPGELPVAQVEFLFEQTVFPSDSYFDFRLSSAQFNVGPIATALGWGSAEDALLDLQNLLRLQGLVAFCWVERALNLPTQTGLYRVRVAFPTSPTRPEIVCRYADTAFRTPIQTITTPIEL